MGLRVPVNNRDRNETLKVSLLTNALIRKLNLACQLYHQAKKPLGSGKRNYGKSAAAGIRNVLPHL